MTGTFLRAVAPWPGAALGQSLLEQPSHTDPARGPGVVVLDQTGTVLSATTEAHAWLTELTVGHPEDLTNVDIPAQALFMPVQLLLMSLGTLANRTPRRGEPGCPPPAAPG